MVEVLVAPGEATDVEQSLIVVESDKASMEIPGPGPVWWANLCGGRRYGVRGRRHTDDRHAGCCRR